MTQPAFDPKAFSEAQATALDLPLPEAYRSVVEAHLAVAFRLAPLFLDFPLEDELEPAPVFVADERS